MGPRAQLYCMTVLAVGCAPYAAFSQTRQVGASFEVSAVVAQTCTVGIEFAPTPGCEAFVSESLWPAERVRRGTASHREVLQYPSLEGKKPWRLVVRMVDF
jgi:hypothetical protein